MRCTILLSENLTVADLAAHMQPSFTCCACVRACMQASVVGPAMARMARMAGWCDGLQATSAVAFLKWVYTPLCHQRLPTRGSITTRHVLR